MTSKDHYTDEEVRAILDRALRAAPDRGMSHEELVTIASEVGVSREAVDRAARELDQEGQRDRSRQQVLRRRRRHLASHAFTFAVLNAFLFVVNFLSTPGQWWVLFPVFIWGLALIFHAWFALSREVSAGVLLKEQRRAAREPHRAHERTQLADRASSSSSAPATSSAKPPARARVSDTPVPDVEEANPELDVQTATPSQRRE